MKTLSIKKKASAILLTVFAAVAMLSLSGVVSAMGEGQIEGGDIYKIKNVSKNTAFADPQSADKCETVQYKVRMHNPGPGVVNNVNVKATLPATASTQNVSTVTITAQNAQPSTRSDTATLNISTAQKVEYISGSTQLLDTYSNVIKGLPDGIIGSGINIGSVGVSLNEIKFVQFKAKVDCPKEPCKDNPNTPGDECHPCKDNPKTPGDECNPCKDNPNTPEDECNPCKDNPKTPQNECKPETPTTPTTPQTPGKLPETGPGAVVASFVGVSSISGLAYHFIRRRFSL